MGKDDSSSSSLSDQHSLVDGGIIGTLVVNSILAVGGLLIFFGGRWCLPSLYLGASRRGAATARAMRSLRLLKLPFGWLVVPLVASLPPARLRAKLGSNAFVFLAFQQLSWYFVIGVSVLALAVVLPVNLLGHGLHASRYSSTTIANMHEDSQLYWVHVGSLGVILTMAAVFFFAVIVLLSRLDASELPPALPVVRLERIPCDLDELSLQEVLEAEFGATAFVSFHVVRDLRRFAKLYSKRARAAERLTYWSATTELAAVRIRPSLVRFWQRVPAGAYYEQLVAELNVRVDAELAAGRRAVRSTGTAFVVLQTVEHARALVAAFRSVRRRWLWRSERRHSADIQTPGLPIKLQRWRATLETSLPNDILFENLRYGRKQKAVRRSTVFLVVCFYMFFFTSPTALLSSLKKLGHLANVYPSEDSAYWLPFHSFFFGFLPALLQYMVGASQWECFRRTAHAELLPELLLHLVRIEVWNSRMRAMASGSSKMLWYLFFGFVLFPSVQSVSLDAFYQQLRHSHCSWYERVGHTFLADSGGFFINYVLELALLGCVVDLLRLGQLAKWLAKRLYMRVFGGATPFEKKESAHKSLEEFDFVFRYATDQVVLGLCVVYGVAVPLLAPACVGYFFHRQFVDRFALVCIDAELEDEEKEEEAVLFEVKEEGSPTGSGGEPSKAPQPALPRGSSDGIGGPVMGLWSASAPDSSARFAEEAGAMPLGGLGPEDVDATAFDGYFEGEMMDDFDAGPDDRDAADAAGGRRKAAVRKRDYLNVQLLRRAALFVFVNLLLQQLLFFAFFSVKGNGFMMGAILFLIVLTLVLFLVVRMLWHISVTSRRPWRQLTGMCESLEDGEGSPLRPEEPQTPLAPVIESYSWLDQIQRHHAEQLAG